MLAVAKIVKAAEVEKEWKHLLGRSLEKVTFVNCNKRVGIFSGQVGLKFLFKANLHLSEAFHLWAPSQS